MIPHLDAHRPRALRLRPALTPGHSPERGGELDAARAEAERARTMSVEMGYHWGRVDADEVLERIRALA